MTDRRSGQTFLESYRAQDCAALGRREIVSGWDLCHWKPKDAEAAVPAGSAYWLDGLEGDAGKLAEWVAGGLWGDNVDRQRRAEVYNLAMLGGRI